MGQCWGKIKTRTRMLTRVRRSRRGQYRHKRFEFVSKKSWKYRDDNLLNEFHEMSEQNEESEVESHEIRDSLTEPNGGDPSPVVNGNQLRLDSMSDDAEGGEVRKGGRLAFDEDTESSDDNEEVTTPLSGACHTQIKAVMEIEERRERSESNTSEKIGRFEVLTIEDKPTS